MVDGFGNFGGFVDNGRERACHIGEKVLGCEYLRLWMRDRRSGLIWGASDPEPGPFLVLIMDATATHYPVPKSWIIVVFGEKVRISFWIGGHLISWTLGVRERWKGSGRERNYEMMSHSAKIVQQHSKKEKEIPHAIITMN